MKLHKIEKISCAVPFFSTFFIIWAAMYDMKRHKASIKRRIYFGAILVVTTFVLFLLNGSVLADAKTFVHFIVSASITTIANLFIIDVQERCFKDFQQRNADPDAQPAKRKKPKKYVLYIVLGNVMIVALIVVLLGIQYSKWVDYEKSIEEQYKDTNGSNNTSLVHITLGDLVECKDINGFSQFVSGAGNLGEEHTLVEGEFADYDTAVYRRKYGTVVGDTTLMATKIDSGTIVLNADIKLESGNAEFIIMIDGVYYDHIPVNQPVTIELNDVAGKLVLVRAGYELAQVSISLDREIVPTS